MLKQTITYKGFDGQSYTEDFYFNLTKEEVISLEMSADGSQGMKAAFDRIIASKDTKVIYNTFKDIVLSSYGERSNDGKRFMKSPELAKAFTETNAFSELIMGFFKDTNTASAFMNGVLPDDIDDASKLVAKSGLSSEEARARSEASLQGHRQAQPQTVSEPTPMVQNVAQDAPRVEQAPAIPQDELEAFREYQRNQAIVNQRREIEKQLVSDEQPKYNPAAQQ